MIHRDTLHNRLVVVVGGSGFLGQHIVQDLLGRGARVRIACRHAKKAFALKPLASLGQLQVLPCDVTKPETVRIVMQGADAVVNLAGAFGHDMEAMMARGAGTVAQLARDAGAQNLVHVSAIGADTDSASAYGKAKAEGENYVRKVFAKATIIRPSVVFGEESGLIPLLAGKISQYPVIPVFAPDAKLQMVYVDDVADAVVAALSDSARHGGKTYELGGPETITMMELGQRIAASQMRKRHFIRLPDGVSGAISYIPFSPMGRDQWLMLKEGNEVSGDLPGLAQLGIKARPLDLYLDRWMVRYRKHGRFTASGPLTS
ncbi:MAG: complex I NDUFA9 subunit family protein [Sphingomonadaceae bacterium]